MDMKKNDVNVKTMLNRMVDANSFFLLLEEDKKISVIVNDSQSVRLLADFLYHHPDILSQVLQDINDCKAQLN